MNAPGLLVLTALVGSCIGSYSATLGLRLARGQQSVLGRSACDHCGVTLGFTRTIPLVSFVQSGGVCAACDGRIDPVHLLGEVLGAVVAVLAAVAALAGLVWQAEVIALMGFTLIATSIVDLKVQRLPHALTLIVALGGVTLSAAKGLGAFEAALVSAAATYGLLELVRRGLKRLSGQSALGGGDVALLAALALWLGPATPWALVCACVGGLLVAVARGKRRGRIAFGPYLAAAAWPIGVYLELAR
jgi:leader peptidase (prepilin peptidase)/N-methyltransferase